MMRFLSLCLFFALLACNSETPSSDSGTPSSGKANEISMAKLDPSISGFNFENKITETPQRNFLYYDYIYNGGGVALADFDNDGLTDIFMTGNDVSNGVFRNLGNMKFEDKSATALPQQSRFSHGVTIVDINNDGYQDIYICNSGPDKTYESRANQLLINNGNFTFTDKAKEYGLDLATSSTQAQFFDYDKDGDLDLWVNNHSAIQQLQKLSRSLDANNKWSALQKQDHPDVIDSKIRFYQNQNGKFVEKSKEMGLDMICFGLGLQIADFNEDGWLDAYVANDFYVPDYYFLNDRKGGFVQRINSFDHISFFGMGCDAADYNNDMILDFMVADMTPSDHYLSKTTMSSMDTDFFYSLVENYQFPRQYMFNALQRGVGYGLFTELGNTMNVSMTGWSWAPLFFDANNDGFKDLYITTGYYRTTNERDKILMTPLTQEEHGLPYDEEKAFARLNSLKSEPVENKFYLGKGDQGFDDYTEKLKSEKSFSHGVAYGDLDNDGDLDLVVNNFHSPSWLFENNSGSSNHLRVKITGKNSSKYLHSQLHLYTTKSKQRVDYNFQRGYLSHMQEIAHFGIPKGESIDSLVVIWPDNTKSKFQNIDINQTLTIESEKATKSAVVQVAEKTLFADASAYLQNSDVAHKEKPYMDFNKEILLPQKYSTLGPTIATHDINKDGNDDLYFGGGRGQAGKIVTVQNGKFGSINGPAFQQDAKYEDLGSKFFHANNDGLIDLYVASGGGGDVTDPALLQDRLYLNQGGMQFTRSDLPKITSSTKAVIPIDIDGDNDMDLFVGGRNVPGKYPNMAESYLLENNNGSFKNIMSESFQSSLPHMVTDGLATDIDGDGDMDLVISGEWDSPSFYKNNGQGEFTREDSPSTINLKGWWYSVSQGDLNKDGKPDFIFGNLGENNKFHVSEAKPLKVLFDDFDENGTQDIVLTKKYKDKTVPVRGKECSTEQMPFLESKFPTFHEFASASVEEILGEKATTCNSLTSNFFGSIAVLSGTSGYTVKELPLCAQHSPIMDTQIIDLNNDGNLDIIAVGRIENAEPETPSYDATRGLVLYGDGAGGFSCDHSIRSTGLNLDRNAKVVEILKSGNVYGIVVGNNNSSPQLYLRT